MVHVIKKDIFADMMKKEINIKNKKAQFEYFLIEKYIAGIQLSGTEIKSIRDASASINEAYCIFKENELFVKNMHIAEYSHGTCNNHEPKRDRKLLLQKKELKKIRNKVKEQGITIVPLRLFIDENGLAKLEISVAKGKKLYDKRDSIKDKTVKREMDRTNKQH